MMRLQDEKREQWLIGFEQGYGGTELTSMDTDVRQGYAEGSAAYMRYVEIHVAKRSAPKWHPECCMAPVPGGCIRTRNKKGRHGLSRFCAAHEKRLSRGSDMRAEIEDPRRTRTAVPESSSCTYDAARERVS